MVLTGDTDEDSPLGVENAASGPLVSTGVGVLLAESGVATAPPTGDCCCARAGVGAGAGAGAGADAGAGAGAAWPFSAALLSLDLRRMTTPDTAVLVVLAVLAALALLAPSSSFPGVVASSPSKLTVSRRMLAEVADAVL